MIPKRRIIRVIHPLFLAAALILPYACSLVTAPYHIAKSAVEGSVWAVKTTCEVAGGAVKVIYKIGEYTYEVVKAPIEWSLTHEEIESIDGLPVKDAIRQNRVKNSPYIAGGKQYVPMSLEEARKYKEEGVASWYGYESGKMTANGEVFNPDGLSAAHKYLPLPMFVKVTNLENDRSLIVRVNDRGPFPVKGNPASGERIIDLSRGAARKLGFEGKGLARVKIEAVEVKEK